MASDDHRYAAFLSYSHSDRRWARWLQRSLESFRLPADLARTHGRRPLYPVFRDEDELAASADLTERIRDALAISRNLVVVCSPAAAASKWVNTEIDVFRALGGNRRVFCLVVAGDPVARDCFPPSLFAHGHEEPLAADVRPGCSRSTARVRLAAGLLDVGFDTLRRRDAQARRARWLGGTGIAALTTAGVVGVTVLIATAPPCTDSAKRLTGVWDQDTRGSVQAAFLASGVSFAPDALQRTVAALDRYATTWIDAHREACEATHVRGEQSSQLLDLRMRCLNERRLDLAAVAELLRAPDLSLIERSIELSSTLPELQRCSDPDALLAAWPLPDDPGRRAAIEALRAPLAVARAGIEAERSATASLENIARSAAALDYPPLAAEGLLLLGRSQRLDGNVQAAEETLHRAAATATRAGDTRTAVEAWLKIVNLQIEYRGAFTEAERLINLADAHIDRIDDAKDLQSLLEAARGNVYARVRKLTAARDAYGRAFELASNAPTPIRAAHAQHLLGVLIDLGELDRAQRMAEALYPEFVTAFGADHRRVADLLWSTGRIAERRSDYAQATTYMQRAIDIHRRAYGDDHPDLALFYQGLAWNLMGLGERDAARAALERTLAICEASPDDVEFFVLASAYNTLGNLLVQQDDDPGARDAFERSIAAWDGHTDSAGVSAPLVNLGTLENRAGHPEKALALCERSVTTDEASIGDKHPDLAWGLLCGADALARLDRIAEAAALLQRADAVLQDPNGSPYLRADARYVRARILWARGEHTTARSLARSAYDQLANADPSFGPRRHEIAAWLDAHR